MLFLLYHVFNLFVFFVEMSTLFRLSLVVLAKYLMLGEEEVSVIFSLLD